MRNIIGKFLENGRLIDALMAYWEEKPDSEEIILLIQEFKGLELTNIKGMLSFEQYNRSLQSIQSRFLTLMGLEKVQVNIRPATGGHTIDRIKNMNLISLGVEEKIMVIDQLQSINDGLILSLKGKYELTVCNRILGGSTATSAETDTLKRFLYQERKGSICAIILSTFYVCIARDGVLKLVNIFFDFVESPDLDLRVRAIASLILIGSGPSEISEEIQVMLYQRSSSENSLDSEFMWCHYLILECFNRNFWAQRLDFARLIKKLAGVKELKGTLEEKSGLANQMIAKDKYLSSRVDKMDEELSSYDLGQLAFYEWRNIKFFGIPSNWLLPFKPEEVLEKKLLKSGQSKYSEEYIAEKIFQLPISDNDKHIMALSTISNDGADIDFLLTQFETSNSYEDSEVPLELLHRMLSYIYDIYGFSCFRKTKEDKKIEARVLLQKSLRMITGGFKTTASVVFAGDLCFEKGHYQDAMGYFLKAHNLKGAWAGESESFGPKAILIAFALGKYADCIQLAKQGALTSGRYLPAARVAIEVAASLEQEGEHAFFQSKEEEKADYAGMLIDVARYVREEKIQEALDLNVKAYLSTPKESITSVYFHYMNMLLLAKTGRVEIAKRIHGRSHSLSKYKMRLSVIPRQWTLAIIKEEIMGEVSTYNKLRLIEFPMFGLLLTSFISPERTNEVLSRLNPTQ